VIVISAFGSLETAVAAIRAGAYDFVTKPFEIEQLAVAVERARQHRELRDEVKRLRQAVADAQPFEDILGESPALRRMCSLVDGVANGESTCSSRVRAELGRNWWPAHFISVARAARVHSLRSTARP